MGNITSRSESFDEVFEEATPIYMPVARHSYILSEKPGPHKAGDKTEFDFVVNGTQKRKLQIVHKLGQGGIGSVFLAIDVTINRPGEPQKYALKIVDAPGALLIQEAVQLVRQFGRENKHVAEIMEDYLLPRADEFENDKLYVILRYYEHKSLESYLEGQKDPFPQPFIEKIIHDLFQPLGLVHSRTPPIIHRDISLCNILVKQVNRDGTLDVVLNDFDVAREISGTANHTKVGKTTYWAPEVFTGSYGTRSDIWSAGVVLYELMTITRVGSSNVLGSLIKDKITECEIHEQMRQKLQSVELYDDELIETVLSMTRYDAAKRPSAIDLYVKYESKQKDLLEYACKTRNRDIVRDVLARGYNNIDGALRSACKSGDIELINMTIQHGAKDWNRGLWGAAEGAQQHVIHQMIKKGANDWNRALLGACTSGNLDVVSVIIQSGVKNWNMGLEGACFGGHIEIVNLMINKGADNWQNALNLACSGGHIDIVLMLMDRGATNLNYGLWYACKYGQMDIVQFMVDRGADDWDLALRGACFCGNIDLIEMMIKKGAKDMNKGLLGACEGQQYDIIEMMIERGANKWNLGLQGGCSSGDLKIIDMMITKGATKWNKGLQYACRGDWISAAELMIEKGANDWNAGLRAACVNSCTAAILLMLKHGADETILRNDYPHIRIDVKSHEKRGSVLPLNT